MYVKSGMSPAFIHGIDLTIGWMNREASLPDLIFGCVSRALEGSGIAIEDVDSVVLSAHDLVDGRSLSSMVTAPAAGAYLRDEIRLAEDGLAAVSLAAARIEACEANFSIVAAWGRASEGDYCRTSRASFDPFVEQPFGVDEFAISAARLSRWISTYGLAKKAREKAARARAGRSGLNPRALRTAAARPRMHYPILEGEAPRFADIAVAAVLGRRETAVRVAGVGHSAELHRVGDRDLLAMPALREATARARMSCGAMNVDICELGGATLSDEALALEALDLAVPGQGFEAYAVLGNINPSGGGERGCCFPAAGLSNLVECYLQLVGKAGAIQVPHKLKHALATSMSPMGGQIAHAVVLEAA